MATSTPYRPKLPQTAQSKNAINRSKLLSIKYDEYAGSSAELSSDKQESEKPLTQREYLLKQLPFELSARKSYQFTKVSRGDFKALQEWTDKQISSATLKQMSQHSG
jgi:hypothetical protein